jgi:hypothetical protein
LDRLPHGHTEDALRLAVDLFVLEQKRLQRSAEFFDRREDAGINETVPATKSQGAIAAIAATSVAMPRQSEQVNMKSRDYRKVAAAAGGASKRAGVSGKSDGEKRLAPGGLSGPSTADEGATGGAIAPSAPLAGTVTADGVDDDFAAAPSLAGGKAQIEFKSTPVRGTRTRSRCCCMSDRGCGAVPYLMHLSSTTSVRTTSSWLISLTIPL